MDRSWKALDEEREIRVSDAMRCDTRGMPGLPGMMSAFRGDAMMRCSRDARLAAYVDMLEFGMVRVDLRKPRPLAMATSGSVEYRRKPLTKSVTSISSCPKSLQLTSLHTNMNYPKPPTLPEGPLNPSLLVTDENVFVELTGVQAGEELPLVGDEMKPIILLEEIYKATRKIASRIRRNYYHLALSTSSAKYVILAIHFPFAQTEEEHQPPPETDEFPPLPDCVLFSPRPQHSFPAPHNADEPTSSASLQPQPAATLQEHRRDHTCQTCGQTFQQLSKLKYVKYGLTQSQR